MARSHPGATARGHAVHLLARRAPVDVDDRVMVHLGDLTRPDLGIEAIALPTLDHAFHLDAVYDLQADAGTLHRTNVDGTDHLIALLERIGSASRAARC